MVAPSYRSPAVRVSAARDMLDLVERFEPGARGRVLDRFPAASLEVLETSPRTSWLAVKHHHLVVDGICEVLGAERAVECWRDSMSNLLDGPLLRNFFSAMIRVSGARPANRVGILVRGWPLVYRDFCALALENETNFSVTLVFDDISPDVRAFPNYFHSFRGICEGFARATRLGAVAFRPLPGYRRAEARFALDTGA